MFVTALGIGQDWFSYPKYEIKIGQTETSLETLEMNDFRCEIEPVKSIALKAPDLKYCTSKIPDLHFKYKEGYWTFDLKPKQEFLQYHEEMTSDLVLKITDSISLGKYSKLSSQEIANKTIDSSTVSYIKQVWNGGKYCDETGENRVTEVHYFCGEEDYLVVKELKTCYYIATVYIQDLCSIDTFSTRKPSQIYCNNVKSPLPEQSFQEYFEHQFMGEEEIKELIELFL